MPSRTKFALLLSLVLLSTPAAGQLKVRPIVDERGEVGLGLAIRRLGTVGTFMMTTAHPDDENNALLAMYRYRDGFRTTLVTATRGDGGQNEIGPELFDALAVLRTEELLAAHRFDGAEQFFTRAVDFGFSFSIDETLEKWGKEEILGDFVRHIRAIRPDVIAGFVWDGEGGGQHHQASSRLTAEAFRAAADPARFPEQVKAGLRPWQAKKFYYTTAFGFPGAPQREGETTLRVDGSTYDALVGRTYNEIASEARSMHKCQGMSQLLLLPGAAGFGAGPRGYHLQDSVVPRPPDAQERDMFDGVDTTLVGVARFAGEHPPDALTTALGAISGAAERTGQAFAASRTTEVRSAAADGLRQVRALRAALDGLGLDATASYEIGFRLAGEERDFEEVVLLASGVSATAMADDGIVHPGQGVKVSLLVSAVGPQVAVTAAGLAGVAGDKPCPGATASEKAFSCTQNVTVPGDAPLTDLYFHQRSDAARYDFDADAPFGLPFRPTPFRARVDLDVAGTAVTMDLPVIHRSERDIFAGEKTQELIVVPSFSVTVSPDIAVVPHGSQRRPAATSGAPRGREVRVTVTNSNKGLASGDVRLVAPPGWQVDPATAGVKFSREDEALTVRFNLTPPASAPVGEIAVRAEVASGGATYARGYEVVEYPHTTRRHVYADASVRVKVMAVATAPNLLVGYVMGVGDQVPPALRQLGARVELIDADTLAWGDLSRYDVIMTGVRAYERRADLRAYNQRLLDYAAQGGTVLVQYNKFEFNEAQYGPYPATVGRERVTAEDSELRILIPDSAVFQRPNKIDASAWSGWVQERGLYFLDDRGRDSRYHDLIELEDPFPYNPGTKHGALVEAAVGKGRWIYVGLGLWRQLPAGTDGAYKLMANLISLGARPAARPSEPPQH